MNIKKNKFEFSIIIELNFIFLKYNLDKIKMHIYILNTLIFLFFKPKIFI